MNLDILAFRGAAFDVHLPVGEELLNKAADIFVKHPELDRLQLRCLGENRLEIKFTISPKIVITRTLQVYLREDLGFPAAPRLHLTIEHGLKVIDRMVIGFIKNRLPEWVRLESKELFVELLPVFELSGMAEYATRIQTAKVKVEPQRLIIDANFKN